MSPTEYTALIDEIDAQIDALKQKQRDLHQAYAKALTEQVIQTGQRFTSRADDKAVVYRMVSAWPVYNSLTQTVVIGEVIESECPRHKVGESKPTFLSNIVPRT